MVWSNIIYTYENRTPKGTTNLILPIVYQGFRRYFLIFGNAYLISNMTSLGQSHFPNGFGDIDLPKMERF